MPTHDIQPAVVTATRTAILTAPVLALLAAGCWREEPATQPAEASPFVSTADHVNRAGKSAPLSRRAHSARSVKARPEAPRFRQVPTPAAAGEARAELARFFAALARLEDGTGHQPVTILHLGDSHIASDRFTADLRHFFQTRFGDAGRGLLMPPHAFDHYAAQGVRFAKHGTWKAASSLHRDSGLFGITGVRVESAEPGAWLRLTSETGAFEWAEVTVLAGPRAGKATLAVDDLAMHVDPAAPQPTARTFRLQHKGSRLTVTAAGDRPLTLLSWAVGLERAGVRYVNLGIPSATADITARWDEAVVAADLRRLQPALIVLGYGTNEGFDDDLDVEAYEARVAGLLRKLGRLAPNADLLVIGPPDAARFPRFARESRGVRELRHADCKPLDMEERRDYRHLLARRDPALARWHAPPQLDAVRKALRRAAARSGAAFWDWSGVMGRACGIHRWSLSEPQLAASDHVHITAQGSRRSAQALFNELMEDYAAQQRFASR